MRTLPDAAVNDIFNHSSTPEHVKAGIHKLMTLKDEVDFYDVYHLTWGNKPADSV